MAKVSRLHHIGIPVSDMELVAEGVAFNAPPMTLEEGDLAGHTFAYFRDPDGIQLEMFELPKV